MTDMTGSPQGSETGNPVTDWRSSLPEDIRSEKSLEHMKDVTEMAKSYINAQKMLGSRIPIPREGEEDKWNELYGKLGRPESPDKYQYTRPETDFGVYSEEMEKKFLEAAHKAGLNSKQVQALMEFEAQRLGELNEVFQGARQEAEQELQKEWGMAYKQKMASAQRAVAALGDETLIQLLDETGLGNHPAIIKWAAKVGEAMGEDSAVGGGTQAFSMTPGQAMDRISQLKSDQNWVKRWSSGDAEAKAELDKLHQFAYPQ